MIRGSPMGGGDGRGALLRVSRTTRDEPGQYSMVKSNSATDIH